VSREHGQLWDCHLHVIENADRFPLAQGRGYDPPLATLEDCLAMLDRHGLTHAVLVQPSVYGFDNRCLLDGLRRAGGRLRGIAVPHPESPIDELQAMHDAGVRGVRCNLINPGGLRPDQFERWLPFMRENAWHVELHIAIDAMTDLHGTIDRIGVPVVIDHMGRPSRGAADAPAFRELVGLVRAGRCFVKLSAPYRLSHRAPPWPDVRPLAAALLDADARGCLWATDWPHPDTPSPIRTDDVIAARDERLADAAARRSVLSITRAALSGGG